MCLTRLSILIAMILAASGLALPAQPVFAAQQKIANVQPAVATAKPAAANAVPAVNNALPVAPAPAADAAAPNAPAGAPKPQESPWGNFGSGAIMIGLLVVLMFFLFGGRAKEEKRRKAMIAAVKKGDRVVTMGGLIASVVDVRDNEVVLKVDESTNVKERYTKSSIVSVIAADSSAGGN